MQSDKPLNSGLGRIIFYWTDASTDETGFVVEIQTGGPTGSWSNVSTSSFGEPFTSGTGTGYSINIDNLAGPAFYTVHVKAVNAAGDYSYWGWHSNTTLDRTKPTLAAPAVSSGTTGDNGWYTSAVGLYINSSDAHSGITLEKHQQDSLGYNAGSSSDTWTDNIVGIKTWYGYAEDSQGNYRIGEDSLEIKFDIAPVAPTVSSSTHPSQGTWYVSDDPDFSWTYGSSSASGIVGYSYVLDQASGTIPDTVLEGAATSKTDYVDYANGIWYFHIRAKNGAGLWGAPAHYTIRIDDAAPTPGTLSASATSAYIYIAGSNIYYSNAMTTNQILTMTVTGASDGSGSGIQYVTFPDILGQGATNETDYTRDYTVNSSNSQTGGATCITRDNVNLTANTNTYQIYRVISENPPTGILFKTAYDGSTINASTWQADRDPYIYWTAPSSSTGIVEYQYKITNADTETELISATSTGANTYVQLSASALPEGRWRVRVRARNTVQIWSGWSAYSDIYVDGTNPVVAAAHLQNGSSHTSGDGYAAAGGITAGTASIYIDYNSITESFPDYTQFYHRLDKAGTDGTWRLITNDTDTATPPANLHTFSTWSETLDGASRLYQCVRHYDKAGYYGDNYGSYYYIKPYTPLAPTVANTGSTTALNVTVNKHASENAVTEHSIYCVTTSQYVQANGTLGATEVFQTPAVWGTKTVTGLSCNTQHTFRTRARNYYSGSVYSDNSPTASRYTSASIPGTATATVAGDGVNSGTCHVDVSWSGACASSYQVRSSSDNYASVKYSGSVASYTESGIPDETAYTYRIYAFNGDSVTASGYKEATSGTVDRSAPTAPTLTDTDVSWIDGGANSCNSQTVRIAVASGDWESYCNVIAVSGAGTNTSGNLSSAQNYDDAGISSSQTVSYKLRSYDASGNYADSSTISESIGDRCPPSAPTLTDTDVTWIDQGAGSGDNQTVNIVVGSGDWESYCVVMAASGNGTTNSGNLSTAQTYADTGVYDNQTVQYYIRSYDASGNYSNSSTISEIIGDRTVPGMDITSHTEGSTNYTMDGLTISGTASDTQSGLPTDGSAIQYRVTATGYDSGWQSLGDTSPADWSGDFSATNGRLPEHKGEITIQFRAKDNVNNYASPSPDYIIVRFDPWFKSLTMNKSTLVANDSDSIQATYEIYSHDITSISRALILMNYIDNGTSSGDERGYFQWYDDSAFTLAGGYGDTYVTMLPGSCSVTEYPVSDYKQFVFVWRAKNNYGDIQNNDPNRYFSSFSESRNSGWAEIGDLFDIVPADPTGASVSKIGPNTARVTWTDNSGNTETGFRVEKDYNGQGYNFVANVGQDVALYDDATANLPGTYTYRVRAYNSSPTTSNWSTTSGLVMNDIPACDSVTPSSGSFGTSQAYTFTTKYTDADGYNDIQYVHLLINTGIDGSNCFYGYYNLNSNLVYLCNDAGSDWGTGYAPGTAAMLSNSKAGLDVERVTVTNNGANELTVNWVVIFKAGWNPGACNSYMYVVDDESSASGWQDRGDAAIDTALPASPAPDDGIGTWTNNNDPTFTWSAVSGANGYYYGTDIYFDVDDFEWANDEWASRNGVDPSRSTNTAYSGTYSLYCPSSWGQNFESGANAEPNQAASFDSNTYPYAIMAYKIANTVKANMLIHLSEHSWRSITMTQTESPSTYAKIATWHPDGWMAVDNAWHSIAINLDSQMDSYAGSGAHTVNSIIWHDGGSGTGITGEFYIDDFMLGKYTTGTSSAYTDIPDGAHKFYACSVDAAGNISPIASHQIQIDTVAPTIAAPVVSSGTLGSNGWYTTDVGLYINSSDALSGIAVEKHKTSGGSYNAGSSNDTWTDSSEGTETWVGYAIDSAGNARDGSDTLQVKIDKTNPACSADNSSSSWRTSNITITLSCSDAISGIASFKYRWDNSDAANGTTTSSGATLSIPSEGTHTLYLWAQDNSGRTNTWNGTYKLDTVNPVCSADNSSSTWRTSNITITLSCSDATSAVASFKYRWDNSDAANGTATSNGATITIPSNGDHTLYLWVQDGAGRTSTWNGPYKLDPVIPTVTFTSHTNGATYYSKTGVITVAGTSQDTGGSGLNYTVWDIDGNNNTGTYNSVTAPCTAWDGASGADTSWSGTWQNLLGKNRIYIADYDNATNFSGWSYVVNFWTDAAAPSTPSNPALNARTSTSITLNVSVPSDNASGSAETWSAGDVRIYIDETTGNSGATDSGWVTGTTYQDTGLSPNTPYSYRIYARDNNGETYGAWHNESGYSSTVTWYTLSSAPTIVLCAAQSDQPLNSELGKIVIDWSGDATAYTLERDTTSAFSAPVTIVNNQAVTTATDTGLTDNTTYYYRVKGRNPDNIWSDYSSAQSATTPDRTKPVTPSLGVAEANCVGYWSFDDTNALGRDYSAYGNNGTVTGAVSATGMSSNALSFDGSGDYVTISNSPTLNPTSAITLEAWIKPVNITTNTYYEIMRQDSGDNRKLFAFQNNGAYLTVGLNTGGSYWETDTPITASQFTDGAWHHVAFTYDSSTGKARVYKDGVVLEEEDHSGVIAAETVSLIIGSSAGTGEFFNGLMDEIRVYNRALTNAEINSHYSSGLNYVQLSARPGDTNLVGYWNMDEGSGTIVNDISGNGNTGTWSGTGSRWITGKYGIGGNFNGADDYISVTQALSIPITASCWVKLTDFSKVLNTFINTSPHATLAISLNRTGIGDIYVYIGNGTGWVGAPGIISSSNMVVNQWHNVTYTCDGTTSTLYLDGVSVGSVNIAPSGWGSYYNFGRIIQGGEYLKGLMDDVRIYNSALTAQQVYNLYYSGANSYAYYSSATANGTYGAIKTNPKVVVVEDGLDGNGQVEGRLRALGFDVTINTALTTYNEVSGYDIIVFDQYVYSVTKSALAKECYDNGKGVLTAGNDTATGLYPILAVGTFTTPDTLTTAGSDFHPTQAGWSSFTGGEGSNSYPTSLVPEAKAIARVAADPQYIGIFGLSNANGGRWIHIQDCTGNAADNTAYVEFINWLAKGFNGGMAADTFGGAYDNFNDGNYNGWIVTAGTWNTSLGYLESPDSSSTSEYIYYSGATYSNFIFEADVNIVSSAYANKEIGLYFRQADSSYADGEGCLLLRQDNQDISCSGTSVAQASSLNTWYHIRVIVNGSSVKYYVDGQLKYSGTIGTTSGYIGIRSISALTRVDNIVIKPIGADKGDTQAPAVPAFYATDATDGSSSHNTSAWQPGISNDNTVAFGWQEPVSNGDDYYYYVASIDSMGNTSNIATNGEFERGSGSDAYNWAPIASSNLSETWFTDAHTGSHSVRTEVLVGGESNTDHFYGLTQDYGNPNTTGMVGKAYMATAWVKANAGVNYHISLWCVYNWSENTARGFVSGTGNGAWQFVQTTLVTPNSGQTNMHVRMSIDTNTVGTQVIWDDFRIVEVKPATVTAPISGYWWAANDTTPETGGTWVARTTNSTITPAMPDGTNNNIYVKAEDGAGNISAAKTYGPFYIDITDPNAVSSWGGQAPSAWTNDNTVTVTWTDPTDATSGLDGFDYSWSIGASDPGTSKNLENGVQTTTSSALGDGNNHYLNMRTLDNAGNWDDTYVSRGPFYVDVTPPAGSLSISFSNTATNGMYVTGAVLTDATQGQEFYEFDCSTSATWDRARAENDNVHECTGMTANKSYSFTYRGSDGVINYTSWSGAYSKYTLPAAPNATCNRTADTWYNVDQGPAFIFTNTAGWGEGGVTHYHYLWNNSASSTPGDADPTWSSSTLNINASNGTWYLHLKSHNPEHASNATILHLGPYKYDGGTPDIVALRGWTTSAQTAEITNNTWQNYDNTVYYTWTDPVSTSDDTFYYTQDGTDPTPSTPTYTTNPLLDLTGSAKPQGTTYVKVLPRNGAGKSGIVRTFILQYDVTGDNITDLRDQSLQTSDNNVWQNIDNTPYMVWSSPFSGDEAPLAWYKDYFGTDSGGVPVKIGAGNTNNYYNPGITAVAGTVYYSKEQARDTATNEGGVAQFIFKYDNVAPTGTNLSYGTITTGSIPVTPYGATDASAGMHATPYYIEYDGNTKVFSSADANSGWITSTAYTPSTLAENTPYAFRLKSRDAVTRTAPNETGWVTPSPAYKYTLLNPPTDGELTFGTITSSSIVVQVAAPPNSASDSTGAEFDNLTGSGAGGSDRAMTAGSYSFTDDTLLPNTLYGYKVRYQNGDGVDTAWNTTEKTAYTLSAVPTAPTVTLYTDTPLNSELGKVKIVVNENGNSAATTYAIYDETTAKYLGSDGLLDNAAEEWHTYAEWGGAGGIVTSSLADRTAYVFKVKAKNSAGTQTAFSGTSSVTTPDRTKPVTPVLALTPVATGSGSVNAGWSAVDGTGSSILGYSLNRAPASNGTYTSLGGINDAFTATNSSVYNIGTGVSINSEKLRITGPASRAWGSYYYVTKAEYSRANGIVAETEAKGVGSTGDYMFGIFDTGTAFSYADMPYALFAYTGNTQFRVYEDSSDRGAVGPTLSADTVYYLKIIVEPAGGAKYYINDILVYDSSYSTEDNLRVGYTVAAQTQDFDNLKVAPLYAGTSASDATANDTTAPSVLSAITCSDSHTTGLWQSGVSNDSTVPFSWSAPASNGNTYYYYETAVDTEGNETNLFGSNIGFEQGAVNWSSSGSPYEFVTDSRNGVKALKITYQAGNNSDMHRSLGSLEIGHTYIGTVWFKGSAGTYGSLFIGDTNGYDWDNGSGNVAGDGTWKKLQVVVTPTDTDACMFYIYARDGEGEYVIYDDYSFYEVKSATVTTPIAGYDIFVNTSTSQNSSPTSDQTGTTYTATFSNGTANYYHVRTIDGAGNWSGDKYIGPYYIDTVAPAPGALSYGTPTAAAIPVTVSGASDATSGLPTTCYYIEYDANATTFSSADGNSGWCNGSYTPSSLSSNTAYAFRWKVRDNAGNETSWQTASPAYKYTLSAVPSITSCTAQTDQPLNSELGKIIINWSGNSTAYTLERDTSSSFTSPVVVVNNQAVTTYTDTGLADRTTYYYRVKGRNPDNNWTAYSSNSSAATPDRTKPVTPVLGLTPVTTGSGSMNLGWAVVDGTGSSVLGYTLARAISSGGTYAPLSGLYDDFSASSNWTLTTGASIASGKLTCVDTNDLPAYTNNSFDTNRIVEVDFTKTAGTRIHLVMRYLDTSNLARFYYNTSGNWVWQRRLAGSWSSEFNPTAYIITNGVTYHAKIICNGNNYKLYINDLFVMQYDNSEFAAGTYKAGLDSYSSTVEYDNFKISPINTGTSATDAAATDAIAPSILSSITCADSHSTGVWQSGVSNDTTVPFSWSAPASNGSTYYYYEAAVDAEGNESNLLVNNEFEKWSSGTSSNPDSFSRGWDAESTVAAETAIKHNGVYSAKYTKTGTTNWTGPIQDIAGSTSTDYLLSCWIYVPTHAAISSVGLTAMKYGTWTGLGTVSVTERDQWIHKTLFVNSSDSSGVRFMIGLTRNSNPGDPVMYIDDCQVVKISSATVTTPIAGYDIFVNTSTSQNSSPTNDQAGTTYTATFSNGTANYYHVRTIDGAGNWSGDKYIGPYYIDTVAPTVTITSHTNGATYYNNTGAFTISGTSQDALSGLNYTVWNSDGDFETGNYNSTYSKCTAWDGASGGDANWSGTWQALTGKNRIYISDYDNAGNFGSWNWSVLCWVDSAGPNAPAQPTATGITGNSATINWVIPADNSSGTSPNNWAVGSVGCALFTGGDSLLQNYSTSDLN
ncbi:MAG: LamG-like jellyroll fold domain-containing protein, partial [Candidatus Omnitrophota bacterium]